MQVSSSHPHVDLPEGLRQKLEGYRRRVWMVKLAEGILAGMFGLLVSYLVVFVLDRLWDTSAWLRGVLLIGGSACFAVWFPLKWHRWVWRTRRLEQAARLLRHKFPRVGDQLLGIVELAHNELEQERSESLCRAAMRQVDREVHDCDFHAAVPNPRHHRWGWAAGIVLALAAITLLGVPAAGTNAFMRWLMPWRNTERYTFVEMDPLPKKKVVAYAEPFVLKTRLSDRTSWSPAGAAARYDEQDPVLAGLDDGGYAFPFPPQKKPGRLSVSVGDARHEVAVEPTARPELTSIVADVKLPDYLEYSQDLRQDIRSGTLSAVKGSRIAIEAQATRRLRSATMNGRPQKRIDDRFFVERIAVRDSGTYAFRWDDHLGLSAKEPFQVTLTALDDEAPTVSCQKLPREQVVLSTEVLSFEVFVQDDFGVKLVGMEWSGIEDPLRNPHPDSGEKLIAVGGPEYRDGNMVSTLSAERDQIRPQSLRLRMFVIDFLPGRQRTYSPTYVLHVLSPEEHAIWLTQRLRKWFRQSVEVYEREQQLYGANKELRALTAEEIDQPDTRRRIERQAVAERTNAQRLNALTRSGEQLIEQAMRNDQFNVATLESWAEMLEGLKDIAKTRMPSVADLLTEAAEAPAGKRRPGPLDSAEESSDSPPHVGVNRDGRSGGAAKKGPPSTSKVPTISDVESGFNDLDDDPNREDDQQSEPSPGALKLPNTVIQGGGAKSNDEQATCPAQRKVALAVEEQEDLLAEFAKIADELKKILGNLEGSTFVKRLKAASRRQLTVAGDLNTALSDDFGKSQFSVKENERQQAAQIAERETVHGDEVYVIQEDLEAYFNRVQQGKFKTVLNEMRDMQVVSHLHDIAEMVRENFDGQSIAQAEFWADTLDRWAEQLVGPG